MNLRAALFLPFYWQLFPQHFLCRLSYFRHLFWWGTLALVLARRFLSVKDQFPNLPLPSEIAQHWPDGGIKLPIWQTITDQRYAKEIPDAWIRKTIPNGTTSMLKYGKQFGCPKLAKKLRKFEWNNLKKGQKIMLLTNYFSAVTFVQKNVGQKEPKKSDQNTKNMSHIQVS